MSARRRRGHASEPEEEPENTERWMASYMDMVTVLMCMFIVLFAMSVVDQGKYEELRHSLATGFGTSKTQTADTAKGIVVPPEKINQQGKHMSDAELAAAEADTLAALRERLRAALTKEKLASTVQFQLDERGLTIRLVGTETFFESNRTDLSRQAQRVLDVIAPILRTVNYQISVEGHADHRRAAYPYPTNWELSSGRAVGVLRRLVEHGGIAPKRISAVGYGDAQPLATGTSAADLALNRRVDIVVLSAQPEIVRKLMAGMAAKAPPGEAPAHAAPAANGATGTVANTEK